MCCSCSMVSTGAWKRGVVPVEKFEGSRVTVWSLECLFATGWPVSNRCCGVVKCAGIECGSSDDVRLKAKSRGCERMCGVVAWVGRMTASRCSTEG